MAWCALCSSDYQPVDNKARVQRMAVLVVNCFRIFEIINLCFHSSNDLEAIHGLYEMLTDSRNLF